MHGGSYVDEMIKRVADRAGISEEQARLAVQTTVSYLKEKVPAPAGAAIDQATSSGSSEKQAGFAQRATDSAKGMFER
jgi:hypothetical protein